MRSELVALFADEFALCGLTRDESVAVLTAGGPRDDYSDAFITAAGEHGAEAFRVDLPPSAFRRGGRSTVNNPLANSPATVEALKQCDLLVDLAYLLWTKEQHEIQSSGTRILTCIASADAIVRLFPSQDRKQRVLEAASLLGSSRELRVTNDGGTDVTYQLGQYSVLAQYGFTDEPGRWDNFPSALVAAAGNDGSVQGQVVLQPGDILFPFNRYASEPVWFKIENGFVTDVKGGVDALLIREHLRSFDDDRAYAISHIGWGMNEDARWTALATGSTWDARAVLGSVLFSTGPNLELGGTNDTRCHLDFPMKGCSLYLDGRLIIDHGEML